MCVASWISSHNYFLFVPRKIPTPDFVIATRGKYQDSKEEQILERVSLQCGLSLSRVPNIGTKPFKNHSASPTVSRGGI